MTDIVIYVNPWKIISALITKMRLTADTVRILISKCNCYESIEKPTNYFLDPETK